MSTILNDNQLTDKMDEVILWLDNTSYLYDELQRINKECIFEYQYYNTWYIIKDKRQEIKSHIWKYRDLVNSIAYSMGIKLGKHQIFKLGQYLYSRELKNAIFNFETGLDATKTVLDILENKQIE